MRTTKEPSSKLPKPIIFKNSFDNSWHDNFDYVEFTYYGIRHIFSREQGWLYNLQRDLKRRKCIQFCCPTDHICSFHCQTELFRIDEMVNAKFVRQPCAVKA